MPFSKSNKRHSQKYWTNHFQNFLKPEIEKLGNIEVSRSDELRGNIVKDIIISLYESDIVIADITNYNPNVFWAATNPRSFLLLPYGPFIGIVRAWTGFFAKISKKNF